MGAQPSTVTQRLGDPKAGETPRMGKHGKSEATSRP
jgi:hypothetical protein